MFNVPTTYCKNIQVNMALLQNWIRSLAIKKVLIIFKKRLKLNMMQIAFFK